MSTSNELTSRRAILTAGFGALAAAAASALGRPDRVEAANGDKVVLGSNNTATRTTSIQGTGDGIVALRGRAPGHGSVGVMGSSNSSAGTGVLGMSSAGRGVYGGTLTGIAVHGFTKEGNGVVGTSDFGDGVSGSSDVGVGVLGTAWEDGVAVRADNKSGVGLEVIGSVRLETAPGVAIIPAGASWIAFPTGSVLRGSEFALLTPRVDIGDRNVWYSFGHGPEPNMLKIHISSPRSRRTPVAWLLLG